MAATRSASEATCRTTAALPSLDHGTPTFMETIEPATYESMPPEIHHAIAANLLDDFKALSALARTNRASLAVVLGLRAKVPCGLGHDTISSAQPVTRLMAMARAMGSTNIDSLAGDVVACVAYAYVVCCIIDGFDTTSRPSPTLRLRQCLVIKAYNDLVVPRRPKHVSLKDGDRECRIGLDRWDATCMAVMGLADPRDVGIDALVHWVGSNHGHLLSCAAPSIFAHGRGPKGLKGRVEATDPVPAGKEEPFTTHQFPPEEFDQEFDNMVICVERAKSSPAASFNKLRNRLDMVCRIAPSTMADIVRAFESDTGVIAASTFQYGSTVQSLLAPHFGRGSTAAATERLLAWIDARVDACLPRRCVQARMDFPDLFPRFSNLFYLEDAYLVPMHKGAVQLWATVRARFDTRPLCRNRD